MLFRQMKGNIKNFDSLSSEEREESLKRALIKSNQLHPALHSQEFETKASDYAIIYVCCQYTNMSKKLLLDVK